MHLLIFMSWKGKLPNSQISTKHQNISTIFCSRVCVWLVAALLSYRWQAPSECSNKKNKPSLLCTATATCWQADTLIPNYSVLSTLCRLWVSEACPTGPQHISQGPFVCPCCPSHTHTLSGLWWWSWKPGVYSKLHSSNSRSIPIQLTILYIIQLTWTFSQLVIFSLLEFSPDPQSSGQLRLMGWGNILNKTMLLFMICTAKLRCVKPSSILGAYHTVIKAVMANTYLIF